jgi:hypothetical protein
MTNLKMELSDSIKIRESLGVKHKRLGVKSFLSHFVNRWKQSGDPKLLEGVNEERTVDRENNKYDQVIIDAKSGKILHEEHEQLDKHKKH